MKSPQTEDGFTKIANELLEAFSQIDASGSAWRVFMVVLRKTYGFHKKEDRISLTQFEQMSKLTRMSVCRGLNELVELKIITVEKKGYINKYSIQKDYGTWGSIKPVTSNKNDTESSIKPVTETSNRFDTYKRKKDNKDTSEQSSQGVNGPLTDKEKNMSGFNKVGDDFLEDDIQIDSDYNPKGKKEKKVSDDVQAVFDLFNNPASALWRMREIERVASQTLFETYGLEKLKIRVQRIQEEAKKKDPLFPLITTPSQLLDKMPNVERYLNV